MPRRRPPSGTGGVGRANITIDTSANTLSYAIYYGNLGSAENNAHIHGYSAPGVASGVVHQLPTPTNPKVGVWNYNEVDEANILNGLTYIKHSHRQLPERRDPRSDHLRRGAAVRVAVGGRADRAAHGRVGIGDGVEAAYGLRLSRSKRARRGPCGTAPRFAGDGSLGSRSALADSAAGGRAAIGHRTVDSVTMSCGSCVSSVADAT